MRPSGSNNGSGWIYSRTGHDDGSIMKVPRSGGDPTVKKCSIDRPWIRLNAPLARAPDWVQRSGWVGHLALDGTNVYVQSLERRIFVDHRSSQRMHFMDGLSINRVPIAGGAAVELVWHADEHYSHEPGGIVVDEASVYFLDSREGTVMKLTPK